MKEKSKSRCPDFKGIAPFADMVGFTRMTESESAAYYRNSGLQMSYDLFKVCQNYFRIRFRTPKKVHLLILDRLWNSEQFFFEREIYRTELSGTNPHLLQAARLYRDMRTALGKEDSPRSLQELAEIGIEFLHRNNAAQNCVRSGHRYFYCADRSESHKNNLVSFHAYHTGGDFNGLNAMLSTYVYGAKPVALLRKEYLPESAEDEKRSPRRFGAIACEAEFNAFQTEEHYIDEIELPIETVANIYHTDISREEQRILKDKDRIYYLKNVRFNNTKDVMRKLREALEPLSFVKRCYSCHNSLMLALFRCRHGMYIDWDAVGSDAVDALLKPAQNRFVLIASPKEAEKQLRTRLGDFGFECTGIGAVSDRYEIVLKRKDVTISFDEDLLTAKHLQSQYVLSASGLKRHGASLTAKKIDRKILRRLSESAVQISGQMDATIGGGVVVSPLSGLRQTTPSDLIGWKFPDAYDDKLLAIACGSSMEELNGYSFMGTVYNIVTAVSKLIASGVPLQSIAFAMTDLFGMADNEAIRGNTLGALLACLYVQNALSIGMFHVAPLRVKQQQSDTPVFSAIAFGAGRSGAMISNVFPKGAKLFRLPIPKDEFQMPDFKYLLKLYSMVNINIVKGNIDAATVVTHDVVSAIIRGTLGEGNGFAFSKVDAATFGKDFGDLIVSVKEIAELGAIESEYLGVVDDSGAIRGADFQLNRPELEKAVEGIALTPSPLYSATASDRIDFHASQPCVYRGDRVVVPEVLIPCFEMRSGLLLQRAFARAGAKVSTVAVDLNKLPSRNEVTEIRKMIERCQVLAFSGCSPIGVVPKGKRIAAFFKNPIVLDAVNELLYRRSGLILGTGEGMLALSELGFLPYGMYRTESENAGLRFDVNRSGDYVSKICRVKVCSDLSPFLSSLQPGDVFATPIGTANGRLMIRDDLLQSLKNSGQIATRFVDYNDHPVKTGPYNPTGACDGIESLTSPDGRIFGCLSHPERVEYMLNCPTPFCTDLFRNAVKFFA